MKRKGYVRTFELSPTSPLLRRQVYKTLTAIWDEHSSRLSDEFVEKQRKFGLSKNEDAKNFLRREIYALGLALLAAPPNWKVADLVASVRVNPVTRPGALENRVFHALIMGVYNDDSQINRQERWTMTRELEYALRHHVPPHFLCGFLYQSGGRKNLLKKLAAGYIEPGFGDGPLGE